MTSMIRLRSLAGPDAGWAVNLVAGFHWIGRATAVPTVGVPIDDPAVEPHHAIVEVAPDGRFAVLQTSGRAPIHLDDRPLGDDWGPPRRRTRLVVGDTLLALGDDPTVGDRSVGDTAGTTRSVLAPMGDGATELARFERDLVAAATARHAAAGRRIVALGVGEVACSIRLTDGRGGTVAPGDLGHAAQVILDRASAATVTVTGALCDTTRLAVSAPDVDRVVMWIVGQLGATDRVTVLVVDGPRLTDVAGIDRPVIVRHRRRDVHPPEGCTAWLDVGDTWRATWWPDLGATGSPVRLHAAGTSPRRAETAAAGRTCTSADAGRSLVVEQVARADPER